MSVAGISSSLFSYAAQALQGKAGQFRQEFQQLGQDLQSGNLSAAQSDFATLQQQSPQSGQTSSSSTTGSISPEFNQLSSDLKSGNLTAAQQDYSSLQQDMQQRAGGHHHHHHHDSDGASNNSSSSLSQLFAELGQDLQSGNVSAAQQAYGSFQSDLQSFAAQYGLTASATASNGVAVTA